jgi:hypothetical protein
MRFETPVTTTVLPEARGSGRKHTPEERVTLVKEGRRLLAEGMSLDAVLSKLEIALTTWNRWNREFVSA